jgi:hypothetical protein
MREDSMRASTLSLSTSPHASFNGRSFNSSLARLSHVPLSFESSHQPSQLVALTDEHSGHLRGSSILRHRSPGASPTGAEHGTFFRIRASTVTGETHGARPGQQIGFNDAVTTVKMTPSPHCSHLPTHSRNPSSLTDSTRESACARAWQGEPPGVSERMDSFATYYTDVVTLHHRREPSSGEPLPLWWRLDEEEEDLVTALPTPLVAGCLDPIPGGGEDSPDGLSMELSPTALPIRPLPTPATPVSTGHKSSMTTTPSTHPRSGRSSAPRVLCSSMSLTSPTCSPLTALHSSRSRLDGSQTTSRSNSVFQLTPSVSLRLIFIQQLLPLLTGTCPFAILPAGLHTAAAKDMAFYHAFDIHLQQSMLDSGLLALADCILHGESTHATEWNFRSIIHFAASHSAPAHAAPVYPHPRMPIVRMFDVSRLVRAYVHPFSYYSSLLDDPDVSGPDAPTPDRSPFTIDTASYAVLRDVHGLQPPAESPRSGPYRSPQLDLVSAIPKDASVLHSARRRLFLYVRSLDWQRLLHSDSHPAHDRDVTYTYVPDQRKHACTQLMLARSPLLHNRTTEEIVQLALHTCPQCRSKWDFVLNPAYFRRRVRVLARRSHVLPILSLQHLKKPRHSSGIRAVSDILNATAALPDAESPCLSPHTHAYAHAQAQARHGPAFNVAGTSLYLYNVDREFQWLPHVHVTCTTHDPRAHDIQPDDTVTDVPQTTLGSTCAGCLAPSTDPQPRCKANPGYDAAPIVTASTVVSEETNFGALRVFVYTGGASSGVAPGGYMYRGVNILDFAVPVQTQRPTSNVSDDSLSRSMSSRQSRGIVGAALLALIEAEDDCAAQYNAMVDGLEAQFNTVVVDHMYAYTNLRQIKDLSRNFPYASTMRPQQIDSTEDVVTAQLLGLRGAYENAQWATALVSDDEEDYHSARSAGHGRHRPAHAQSNPPTPHMPSRSLGTYFNSESPVLRPRGQLSIDLKDDFDLNGRPQVDRCKSNVVLSPSKHPRIPRLAIKQGV